jgi:hypothetical protein
MELLILFISPQLILDICRKLWHNPENYKGGINWSTQISGINYRLNSVYFIDANIGSAVGDVGTILNTINGGITNLNNNNIEKPEVLIYPNPVNDIVQIECPQNTNIEIINTQGQIIKKLITTNSNTTIDLTKLSGGVYIMKIKTINGIIVKKLIKE